MKDFTLQILDTVYLVKFIDNNRKYKDLYGMCRPDDAEIWINLYKAKTPEMIERTIKHEIFHAILAESGVVELINEDLEECLCKLTEKIPYINYKKILREE